MRILIVNRHIFDGVGGSELQCHQLATEWARLGHEVLYAAIDGAKHNNSLNYRVTPLHDTARGLNNFLFTLRAFDPHIVYWRYNKRHLLRTLISVRRHRPRAAFVFAASSIGDVSRWTFKGSGPLFRFNSSPHKGARQLADLVLNGADLIRSAVAYECMKFVDAFVVLNKDYLPLAPRPAGPRVDSVVHNSVPEGVVPFAWPRPYVAWVSNFKPIKRPEVLIDIAHLVGAARPNVDFLMIGSTQEDRYKMLVQTLPKNTHYIGSLSPEQVNGVLANATMLVHTSAAEGFGNVFIQAWLQGRPTISVYFDPEGLINEHGIGFVPGDVTIASHRIVELLDDEELRTAIGEKARTIAKQKFDARVSALKYLSLFNKALGQRS